jgi:hypothetical protein
MKKKSRETLEKAGTMSAKTTPTMSAPWMLDVDDVGIVEVRSSGPYVARSASDNDPDWPFWYIAGPDGRRNVVSFGRGAVLCCRKVAEAVADAANKLGN